MVTCPNCQAKFEVVEDPYRTNARPPEDPPKKRNQSVLGWWDEILFGDVRDIARRALGFLKRKVIDEMNWRGFWDGIGWMFMGLAVLVVVCGLTGLIYKGCTADDRVEYCFIQARYYNGNPTGKFTLWGYRRWDTNNLDMGEYNSVDEAKAVAEKLNCRLGIK